MPLVVLLTTLGLIGTQAAMITVSDVQSMPTYSVTRMTAIDIGDERPLWPGF